MTLAGYVIAIVVAGVFGGSALSGAISGHGFGIVAPERMSATMLRLATRPSDPAGVWLGDPRPGPAWLTWLCIGLVAALWCAAIAVARCEIDARVRRRQRDGLAGSADLHHLGLDRRSADQRSASEYPLLAQQWPRRRSMVLRWGRR